MKGSIARILLAVAAMVLWCACHRPVDTNEAATPIADRVTIVAPRDETSFMVGDDILIEAMVQAGEPIQRLEFWSNGGVIKTLERPPYRMTMHKAGPGGYRMHAMAHTATRKIASAQIRISVLMREEERMREPTAEDAAALSGGVEPKVFFDSPTPRTTLRAPADIAIEGWAVFPAAALKSITILGDGMPLATLTATPFKHVWRGVGRGRHIVAVRAVDAEDRTTVQSETVLVE